jgi:hypothetical protein
LISRLQLSTSGCTSQAYPEVCTLTDRETLLAQLGKESSMSDWQQEGGQGGQEGAPQEGGEGGQPEGTPPEGMPQEGGQEEGQGGQEGGGGPEDQPGGQTG